MDGDVRSCVGRHLASWCLTTRWRWRDWRKASRTSSV